jgi:hypothetical protein
MIKKIIDVEDKVMALGIEEPVEQVLKLTHKFLIETSTRVISPSPASFVRTKELLRGNVVTLN